MVEYKTEKAKNAEDFFERKLQIPLIENSIHEFVRYPGEGYFSIGVKGIDEDNIKVWVDRDEIINWRTLDECHIKNWPRFLYYTGNDTSFVEWSQTRKIEEFTWKPLKKMKVDFSKSIIDSLYINSDYELKLTFGNDIIYLNLFGNLNNYIIEKCIKVPFLRFYPEKDDSVNVYKIPKYDCFKDAKQLLIETDPNGAPFDCMSLVQFPKLELLYIIGNVTNLHVLKELKYLKKLGFWDVPDLSNVPALNSWNDLNNFVAMNIDETIGKRLRKELSELKKVKKFDFASVTKLRNKLWFETEYGIPFSNWQGKNKKAAMNAYKNCLKAVKESQTKKDIKNAIVEFVQKINLLENIETTECEDVYEALYKIMKNSLVEINSDEWSTWFDKVREF